MESLVDHRSVCAAYSDTTIARNSDVFAGIVVAAIAVYRAVSASPAARQKGDGLTAQIGDDAGAHSVVVGDAHTNKTAEGPAIGPSARSREVTHPV